MAVPPTKKKGERKRVPGTLKVKTPTPPADENLSSIAEEIISETDANIREIRARVEEAFNALGTDQLQGTVIPAGAKNNSREAAEYVIADALEKLATKRKKKAAELADKAGVFGDSSTYVEGDTVMVFNDPNFSINVKMGTPSRMIGREEVEAAAIKHLGKKAPEFLEECFKLRSATKQIIVSIK